LNVSHSGSTLDAARKAAGDGDYELAERLLRRTLESQEAGLGSVHPERVDTLNNLAVVCERLGKVADAEDFYRRAHAVAVGTLLPGHPSVVISLANLVEFCEVHRIPLWRPPPAPPDGDTPPLHAATRPREPGGAAHAPPPSPARRVAVRAAALTFMAGSLAALVFSLPMLETGDSTEASVAPVASAPAAAPPPAAPARTRDPQPPAPQPAVSLPGTSGRGAPALERSGRSDLPARAAVTVLEAQVCRVFERRAARWQCTPAPGVSPPGTFTFYTRLAAQSNTTVEHRWYRGGRLHQTIRLSVGANPDSGFRTYSRGTVSSERAGEWQVELRSADGLLLHEQRFVVR
jgi:hypothetical protein